MSLVVALFGPRAMSGLSPEMRTKGDIRRRLWIYKFRPGRIAVSAGWLRVE